MKQFVDSKNRKWTLAVNVVNAKRVRDVCGVNVLDLYANETAVAVFGDPITLVQVLLVLCQSQIDALSISDDEFCDGIVGDTLERAAHCLLESVADFFPQAKRQTLNKIQESAQKIAEKTQELDAIALKELDQKIESMFSSSATN